MSAFGSMPTCTIVPAATRGPHGLGEGDADAGAFEDDVVRLVVDGVATDEEELGRAEGRGAIERLGAHVAGADDRRCTGVHGRGDDEQPDGAGADHEDALAARRRRRGSTACIATASGSARAARSSGSAAGSTRTIVVLDDQVLGGPALAVRVRRGAAEVVAAGAQVRAVLEAGHARAVARGVHGHRSAGGEAAGGVEVDDAPTARGRG